MGGHCGNKSLRQTLAGNFPQKEFFFCWWSSVKIVNPQLVLVGNLMSKNKIADCLQKKGGGKSQNLTSLEQQM